MNTIKKIIKYIITGKISLMKTFIFYLKTSRNSKTGKHLSVIIGSKVKMTIDKNFKVLGNGKLFIGHDIGKFPRGSSSAIRLGKNSQIIIRGNYSLLSGHQINLDDNAILDLGSGYLNHDAKITCKKSIKIGNNVIIGEDVRILDSDSHSILGTNNSKEIIIEDNVWVGIRCTILKGVRIGSGSVIAANSLVTKSIPQNCIAAGVPAVVIKQNIVWEQ